MKKRTSHERSEASAGLDGDTLVPLLEAWQAGSDGAADELFGHVVDELRRIAAALLRREREGHTLQPTALVNELYLKLSNLRRLEFRDRTHFFSLAARAMRQILVDHARAQQAAKRGPDWVRTQILPVAAVRKDPVDVLALEEALQALDEVDSDRARFVVLRFYGGLTVEESAAALDLPLRTAQRHWRATRAWLADYLSRTPPGGAS